MHLKDQGFSFCISPDKKEGKWVHPSERLTSYAEWVDVTDWPSNELVVFLMPAPEQQDLFAA